MKHGDIEFHELTAPILELISSEGLEISKRNGWGGVVVEMVGVKREVYDRAWRLRCSLVNPLAENEVDEPSAVLLDAVNRLQEAFTEVGTPLARATMSWEKGKDGRLNRLCRYVYDD